jgi:hypothetical protein
MAFANRGDTQSAGHLCGDVFHTVYGQVNPSIQKSVFQLLDEDTLCSHLRKTRLLELIPGSFDDDQLGRYAGNRS